MSSFVKASGNFTPVSADPGEEFPFLHTITVVDRVVSVDKPELVQNNIKTETVTLNLDSEWEGLSTVINIGNEKPVSVIWSGEPVVIPAELMTAVGSLDVSVVGYGDDGGIRAVTKQAKSVFTVVASGYVEGDEAVPDPTTILGQLIQAADNANQAADRFNQASEDIEGIGPAVEKVQASEANAKQSETNAASSAQSASQSASAAAASAEAAKASETNAASSASSASEASTAAKQSETNAASSASAASQSASQAQSSATAAGSSAQAASASSESAKMASDSAMSSKDAAARSASEALASASAAKASETNAASSASAAKISETNAAASATAAQQAVDGFGLEVGTTTTGEPGTDAAVAIQKNGTKYTASFTIPRGDVGPAGVNENVPLGSTSGVVAQALDAYPALPRKVQVHGRTIENLWPEFSKTLNGITLTCDSSGLFHVSGTATAATYMAGSFNSGKIQTNTRYTILYEGDPTGLQQKDWSVYANLYGKVLRAQNNTGALGTSGTDGPSNANVYVAAGVSIDRYFRVMLVEGDTVPDVFTPSGVHTVEPEKLVIAGKNLVPTDKVTIFNNNNYINCENFYLPVGKYLNVLPSRNAGDAALIMEDGTRYGLGEGLKTYVTIKEGTGKVRQLYCKVSADKGDANLSTDFIQITVDDESEYYPGTVSETDLPEGINLSDGDTLTIDRDGTTRIFHADGEPTVLENVTLPELPAPTFNVYTTGGYIQPTVDVDYERDVNLALDREIPHDATLVGNGTKSSPLGVGDLSSNYVPLSTYRALETRVQALEAKLVNQ